MTIIKTINMKKSYAFLALALTFGVVSCSTDDLTGAHDGSSTTAPISGYSPEGSTIFSAVPADTAASASGARQLLVNMKYTRKGKGILTWADSDQLWIERSANDFVKSTAIAIQSDSVYADFTFAGTYSNTNYNMRYTGKNAVSANQVTIAAEQTQSEAGNSEHLEVSGDCGYATATHRNGSYTFTLEHAASYLALFPRTKMMNNNKIVAVEITDVAGQNPLAGVCEFTQAGLGNVASSSSNKITLTLNTPFAMTASPQDDKGLYIVIKPGEHKLEVAYIVEYNGTKMKIKHELNANNFLPNKVYDINTYLYGEDLKDVHTNGLWNVDPFSVWDAADFYLRTLTPSMATKPVSGRSTDRLKNWAQAASKYSPTYVTAMWFLNGFNKTSGVGKTIYYDPNKTFHFEGRDTYKGGVWIPRLRNFNMTATRSTQPASVPETTLQTSIAIGTSGRYEIGAPPELEKHLYFFLPALGQVNAPTATADYYENVEVGTEGYYWLSTGYSEDPSQAYVLHFNKDVIEVVPMPRTKIFKNINWENSR